jgi:hypothetical protein
MATVFHLLDNLPSYTLIEAGTQERLNVSLSSDPREFSEQIYSAPCSEINEIEEGYV